MPKFNINITEILSREIEIKATDKEAALEKVRELYKNEEIVLDSEDYLDTEIKISNKS